MMRRSFLALSVAALCLGAAPAEEAVLIRGARVFDGSGAAARVANVLVRDGKVAAVGAKLRVPRGTRIVDAEGLTLIPGLHDLHIHTGRETMTGAEALASGYRAYLAHGVTTVNEYSVWPDALASLRAMKAVAVTPHINLALRLGVPHGHGTESDFTNGITTKATTPAEARVAMAQLLPFKPDVFKVFSDGWRYGDPDRTDRPSMDLPTLREIVRLAHARRIPVVTHTVSLEGAKIAARAGVDAVVHGVGDAPVDDELIRLMKRHGTAYVSTLAVYEPQSTRTILPAEWAKLSAKDRTREERRRAAPAEAIEPYAAKRWAVLQDNLRRLKAGGVTIGVGTDTGIGGVYQGSAAIRELRLMTSLGFTPAEALRAATSVSAAIMHQGRTHGRIAKGQHADLVLVGGRPDERIEDLYQIRSVFVNGREVTLQVPSRDR